MYIRTQSKEERVEHGEKNFFFNNVLVLLLLLLLCVAYVVVFVFLIKKHEFATK